MSTQPAEEREGTVNCATWEVPVGGVDVVVKE